MPTRRFLKKIGPDGSSIFIRIAIMRKNGESTISPHSETIISIMRFIILSHPDIEIDVLSTTGIHHINVSFFGNSYTYGSIFGYA